MRHECDGGITMEYATPAPLKPYFRYTSTRLGVSVRRTTRNQDQDVSDHCADFKTLSAALGVMRTNALKHVRQPISPPLPQTFSWRVCGFPSIRSHSMPYHKPRHATRNLPFVTLRHYSHMLGANISESVARSTLRSRTAMPRVTQ